jgi:cephalosporin-C deacetylase
MPKVEKLLQELLAYPGTNPKPDDFDEFWAAALHELDAVDPDIEWVPVDYLGNCNTDLFDLFFTGVGGARVHAKYLRPRGAKTPHPALLQFHGYGDHSGEWCDKLTFVSQGYTVAALDCRGQAGLSEDNSQAPGNTLNGHLLRGLGGPLDKILFRQIFLDTVQLARIVMAQPEVDPDRVATLGGSQGGGLALACAALEPRIRRVVSLFPFLCDYEKAWELDTTRDAHGYGELRAFFRHFDPLQKRHAEIFRHLGYTDVQHLVSRIRADVLMCLTLGDISCPPATQFAAFNKITSKKTPLIYPNHGHEGPRGFWDQAFAFLMEFRS